MTRKLMLTPVTLLLSLHCLAIGAAAAASDFAIQENPQGVTLTDKGKPVLVFNAAEVKPPEGVDQKFRRGCYIHPLYDLDGNVITQDFPKDHFHHRGVFWAWPNCHVGDRKLNVWELVDARPVFEKWTEKGVSGDTATFAVENGWYFDGDSTPIIREHIRFVVHPVKKKHRDIDFELTFENVAGDAVTFQGSPVDKKGYGGFCFRPDDAFKPFTFTAISGLIAEDALSCPTPWADIAWKNPKSNRTEGVAVFQHPSNPGFPHPGWIMRHYAFLGASWPQNDPYTLKPGESFTLRYRLVIHKGDATKAKLGSLFEDYQKSAKP
ncbi:MAG: PmoA family protein [Candidatus Hydrogenedentes bacterium]|nr:PmoA family protein [Candidatus Hydrogenedentota bacterium]